MVLSWLLNSLSKEIAESVLYSQSAKDLWSDLEDRFGQANGAKLFQLQKELSSVVQGNSSVSTYFTKIKSLWDELDALNTFSVCVCECECGAKVKSLKAHQDERLLQFLMGLNDIFIGVRSNILLSSPLPSIGQAYSFVIQDEKQREIHATPAYSGESASFIATNQQGSFRKFNENRMQKTSFESKKYLGICSYCKKPGHNIQKCYRIHGFPADFKFIREKRFQGSAQANKASFSNQENEEGSASGVQNLTKENVAELLQLLQQVRVGHSSAETPDVAANVSHA
uniref:Retrotransposon gag domain-containing protein n=1 Tax=Nicotiana tabacum TaxID=4097 RepID=A0A1S4C6M0_TOBAC